MARSGIQTAENSATTVLVYSVRRTGMSYRVVQKSTSMTDKPDFVLLLIPIIIIIKFL